MYITNLLTFSILVREFSTSNSLKSKFMITESKSKIYIPV
jgi:hypothetical protein